MIGKKINAQEFISLSEVKDILKERLDLNEKGVEPSYEQNLASDYVKKFVKLTPAKAKKLLEELKKLDFLQPQTAIKIADIVPEDEDILNLIFSKSQDISDAQKKEVLETVKKFSK